MKGWISLHRKFLDWQWYTDANVMRLFIHLLIKANHTKKIWRDITINRGELITGRKQLSAELQLSEQVIRTTLKKLEKTQEITIKSTNKYSIITVCNYDSYQDNNNDANQQVNQQITNNQPTNNQQITTTNNDNNLNNDNNGNNNTLAQKEFLHEKEVLNNVFKLFDVKVIQSLNENSKNKWLDEIRKLHEIDKFSYDEIEQTIIWGRNDEFWAKNFHSILGLRQKGKDATTKFYKINQRMNADGTTIKQRKRQQLIADVAASIAEDPFFTGSTNQ